MAGSLKFDTWLNDDDTENYKCRAWVNFDGTGTVAIRASGNVSSITDNGTGSYNINYSIDMPDANYSVLATAGYTLLTTGGTGADRYANAGRFATSSMRIATTNENGGLADFDIVSVAIFR